MRKSVVLTVFVLTSLFCNGQITYNMTSYQDVYVNKFSVGYKLVDWPGGGAAINVYNLNHAVYKVLTPPLASTTGGLAFYITDKLFDLDTGLEYAYVVPWSGPGVPKFYIFDETGATLFTRDSVMVDWNYIETAPWQNNHWIFFDGNKTRMKLPISGSPSWRYEYYTLPGALPCYECNGGIITSVDGEGEPRSVDADFYPNPASSYLKLKYKLPPGAKRAFIKVLDMNGKLIQSMEVTNTFDDILLPPEFNNGLYVYSLIVDGVVVKSDKIVLVK